MQALLLPFTTTSSKRRPGMFGTTTAWAGARAQVDEHAKVARLNGREIRQVRLRLAACVSGHMSTGYYCGAGLNREEAPPPPLPGLALCAMRHTSPPPSAPRLRDYQFYPQPHACCHAVHDALCHNKANNI